MKVGYSSPWYFAGAWITTLLLASFSHAQSTPSLQKAHGSEQTYPTKPVRFIVPYAAGGSVDLLARYLGRQLTTRWGQIVVVDARPGAGGTIGMNVAAAAQPDGYTMLLGNAGPITINPLLQKKSLYDPFKDLSPVTLIAKYPLVLMVAPTFEANSLKDIVQMAKAKPASIAYASVGVGGAQHLAMELMSSMAGIKMLHVPYKGGTPAAVTDLMNGSIQVMFTNIVSALPLIKADRVRPIAVSSARRSSVLPNVPSIAELGFPAFDITGWAGIYVPVRTPHEIVMELNRHFVKILKQADVKEWFAPYGAEVIGSAPESLTNFTRRERALYERIIKAAGLQPW